MTECKLQEKETSKKSSQRQMSKKVQLAKSRKKQLTHCKDLKGRANKLHNLLSRDKELKEQRNYFSFKEMGNLYSKESA